MASIGNNTSAEIADFRDAFMTREEKTYNNVIDMALTRGGASIDLASTQNISPEKMNYVDKVVKRIIQSLDKPDSVKFILYKKSI